MTSFCSFFILSQHNIVTVIQLTFRIVMIMGVIPCTKDHYYYVIIIIDVIMDIIIRIIIVIIIFTRIYITIVFNYYQVFFFMFFVVVGRIEIVFKCILCIIIMYLNVSSIVLVIVSLLFPLHNIS